LRRGIAFIQARDDGVRWLCPILARLAHLRDAAVEEFLEGFAFEE
jgi:hypothetical protein